MNIHMQVSFMLALRALNRMTCTKMRCSSFKRTRKLNKTLLLKMQRNRQR
jgi:hypothetical protein